MPGECTALQLRSEGPVARLNLWAHLLAGLAAIERARAMEAFAAFEYLDGVFHMNRFATLVSAVVMAARSREPWSVYGQAFAEVEGRAAGA